MPTDKILIKGAREHNLKNIDVEIPRDKLVVITGLSGSGKSSLAFDTIYAEGQRRYVESLSSYARQFLGLMEKPDVDYIEGLSPAISIEQRTSARNPRSTVGTVTEIYDYLRLLYSRVGTPHCHKCGKKISSQTPQQIVDSVLALPEGARIQVLAPLVRGRKGEYRDILERVRREGYVRVRVDGETHTLDEEIRLAKNKKHELDVVVDRLVVAEKISHRLSDSVETALRLGDGIVLVDVQDGAELKFSERFACVDCGISFEEIEPRLFSFNSPYGACPTCSGLGSKLEIDPDLMVPDPSRSVNEGAVACWGVPKGRWILCQLEAVSKHFGIDLGLPFERLGDEAKSILLGGSRGQRLRFVYRSGDGSARGEYTGQFEGAIPNLSRRYRQTQSSQIREWIEGFMTAHPCQSCGGTRLRPEALAVKIAGLSVADVCALSIQESLNFFRDLELTPMQTSIATQILKETRQRLGFLVNVGVDYLTLERSAGSLSGGEAQRIRLATQIGSQLVGVLYILDEPSIGLHQRDNRKLIDTLTKLRDLGNTVVVVEHDRETIEAADWVIDLGPRAGEHGGHVVAKGPPSEIARNGSLTGDYLAGRSTIPVPRERRTGNGKRLSLHGAEGNNLKGIDVDFPLGTFICVTGVSGSGKSSLIEETLRRVLARRLHGAKDPPLKHRGIDGIEHIDKMIDIDQSPIGRTPRSNPATYTGLFTPIRDLYTQLPEAKVRGYQAGRFSFNVKGGRCEACEGDGIIKIEMHFLPDVYVQCEVCHGSRYNRETLEVAFKGKSIAEVLGLTVDEAFVFFESIPPIKRKLATLAEVGLGYIRLGQSATTLSGGEAQRVKLATELSKVGTGNTLYLLDEPTTGLHFEDIKMLLSVLDRLVERGNTIIVIEHNLDVIKMADYIIDLGPDGGDAGGWMVAEGTPEDVAGVPESYTGRYLAEMLA